MTRKRVKDEKEAYFKTQLKILNDFKDEEFKYNALYNISHLKGDDATKALTDFIVSEINSALVSDALDMLNERQGWGLISEDFDSEMTNISIRVLRESNSISAIRQAIWYLCNTKDAILADELYSALFNGIRNDEEFYYFIYFDSLNSLTKNHRKIHDMLLENLNSKDLIESSISAFALFADGIKNDKIITILESLADTDLDNEIMKFIAEFYYESIDRKSLIAREKIDETLEILQKQPDSQIKDESIEKLQQLEGTMEDLLQETREARNERDALREEMFGTRKSIESTFKKRDYLEVRGHKETLQVQIDSLKTDVAYVKQKADKKISIKDEFAGAWKFFIILSALVSLALVIIKIYEIVKV